MLLGTARKRIRIPVYAGVVRVKLTHTFWTFKQI